MLANAKLRKLRTTLDEREKRSGLVLSHSQKLEVSRMSLGVRPIPGRSSWSMP